MNNTIMSFIKTVILLCSILMMVVACTRQSSEPNQEMATQSQYNWSAPTSYPDRISLNLYGDPASFFSVTWRTDTTVTKAKAEIAVATAAPKFWRTSESFQAKTTVMDARDIQNAALKAHYHSVVFDSLKPNTLYAYRVGDGETWSEWIHYRTAADKNEPFSFLYVGDAQNEILNVWSRLIREGYRRQPNARFIIHAGDLVNRAHKDSEWHEWFEAGGFIHRMLPAVPVPGNHEYNEYNEGDEQEHLSVQWKHQFTLPENGPEGLKETAYYIDYQGLRIVGLNSDVEDEYQKQAEWLDEVLSNNDQKWTILTFHHPVFSASQGRDNEEIRQIIKPVIDKHQVDMVLNGHDHSYARGNTSPAAAKNIASGVNLQDKTGTVYVVSVSGGKMYTLKPEGWDNYEGERKRAAENTQLFQEISIHGDTLSYRSYTATQQLYDAFNLVKGESGFNELVELENDRVDKRTHSNTIPYEDPAVFDFEQENFDNWQLTETNKGVTITHDKSRNGRHSAKVEPQENNPSFLIDNHDVDVGATTWYGFSIYLPEAFNTEERSTLAVWESVPDNNIEKDNPPPISLYIEEGNLQVDGYFQQQMMQEKPDVNPAFMDKTIPLSISQEKWLDIIFEINWDYTKNGFVNMIAGDKKYELYKGPIGFNDDDGPTFKLGLSSMEHSNSGHFLYVDEYRRGTNLNEIDPNRN